MDGNPTSNTPTKSLFTDIDEFCSSLVVGQEIDFRQLEAGQCKLQLQHFQSTSLAIQHLSMNRRFLQQALMPPTMVTFGLTGHHNPSMKWNTANVQQSTLLVFTSGGQFECVSEAGFNAYCISVSMEKLAAISQEYEIDVALEKLGRQEQNIPLVTSDAEQLSFLLKGVQAADTAQTQQEINDDFLLIKLLSLLPKKPKNHNGIKTTVRSKALDKARFYIENNSTQALVMNDIALASHSTQRSLQRAFLEYFEVSPKQYLKIIRLTNVRNALLNANSDASISVIATDCGFAHLGKFSGLYRQHFGEYPRQTLRRS